MQVAVKKQPNKPHVCECGKVFTRPVRLREHRASTCTRNQGVAEKLVLEHQEAGDVVAIISGATRFVVEPLARRLGIEHMLYTRLEVEDGRFTGRVVEPVCFEEGKIYWIQQFIEEHDIDLAKSFFYTEDTNPKRVIAGIQRSERTL